MDTRAAGSSDGSVDMLGRPSHSPPTTRTGPGPGPIASGSTAHAALRGPVASRRGQQTWYVRAVALVRNAATPKRLASAYAGNRKSSAHLDWWVARGHTSAAPEPAAGRSALPVSVEHTARPLGRPTLGHDYHQRTPTTNFTRHLAGPVPLPMLRLSRNITALVATQDERVAAAADRIGDADGLTRSATFRSLRAHAAAALRDVIGARPTARARGATTAVGADHSTTWYSSTHRAICAVAQGAARACGSGDTLLLVGPAALLREWPLGKCVADAAHRRGVVVRCIGTDDATPERAGAALLREGSHILPRGAATSTAPTAAAAAAAAPKRARAATIAAAVAATGSRITCVVALAVDRQANVLDAAAFSALIDGLGCFSAVDVSYAVGNVATPDWRADGWFCALDGMVAIARGAAAVVWPRDAVHALDDVCECPERVALLPTYLRVWPVAGTRYYCARLAEQLVAMVGHLKEGRVLRCVHLGALVAVTLRNVAGMSRDSVEAVLNTYGVVVDVVEVTAEVLRLTACIAPFMEQSDLGRLASALEGLVGASADAAATQTRFAQRLIMCLAVYAPQRLGEAKRLLAQHRGVEEGLFDRLWLEYGPEPSADEPKARLAMLLLKHSPEQLPKQQLLIERFDGRVEDLYAALAARFGVNPPPPAAPRQGAPTWSRQHCSRRSYALGVLWDTVGRTYPARRGQLTQLAERFVGRPDALATAVKAVFGVDLRGDAAAVATSPPPDMRRSSAPTPALRSRLGVAPARPGFFNQLWLNVPPSHAVERSANIAEPNDTTTRVQRFFARYMPQRLPDVGDVLATWRGREELLLDALVAKYGPEPEASGAVDRFQHLTRRRGASGALHGYYAAKGDATVDALVQRVDDFHVL